MQLFNSIRQSLRGKFSRLNQRQADASDQPPMTVLSFFETAVKQTQFPPTLISLEEPSPRNVADERSADDAPALNVDQYQSVVEQLKTRAAQLVRDREDVIYTTRMQLGVLEQETNELQEKMSGVVQRRSFLEKTLLTQQEKYQAGLARSREIQGLIKQMREDESREMAVIDATQARVHALENNRTELEAQARLLEEEVDHLKAQIALHQQQVQQAPALSQLASQQAEIDAASVLLKNQEAVVEAQRHRLAVIKEEQEALRAKIAKREEEIDSLQQRRRELKNQVNVLQQEVAGLTSQMLPPPRSYSHLVSWQWLLSGLILILSLVGIFIWQYKYKDTELISNQRATPSSAQTGQITQASSKTGMPRNVEKPLYDLPADAIDAHPLELQRADELKSSTNDRVPGP